MSDPSIFSQLLELHKVAHRAHGEAILMEDLSAGPTDKQAAAEAVSQAGDLSLEIARQILLHHVSTPAELAQKARFAWDFFVADVYRLPGELAIENLSVENLAYWALMRDAEKLSVAPTASPQRESPVHDVLERARALYARDSSSVSSPAC